MIKAIKAADKLKLPVFILGGGSNLLVSDKGFKGLVIKIQAASYKIQGNKVYAEAGADLTELVYATANAGLSGLKQPNHLAVVVEAGQFMATRRHLAPKCLI